MADKKYKINFNMTDGTTQSVQFSVPNPAIKDSSKDTAIGEGSFAFGENATATGKYSIAGGSNDSSLAPNQFTEPFGELEEANAKGNLSMAYGASATARSAGSMAFGVKVSAGVYGYYWSNIDFSTNVIALSTEQFSASKPTSLNWEVGDRISIVNNEKYSLFSTITAVDTTNMTITVDKLPFTESAYTDEFTDYNPDDKSIYVPEKPDAGVVEFGWGAYAHGSHVTATGHFSAGFGYNNIVAGDYALVGGRGNEAGYGTLVGGLENKAHAILSFASGSDNELYGNSASASGQSNKVYGKQAHAEGNSNIVGKETELNSTTIGYCAHAEGKNNTVEGTFAHAEGFKNTVTGERAHAEGCNNTASGYASHVEGGSYNTASGKSSHAEGTKTTASGDYSHAEGQSCVASGINSHAEGDNTTASEEDAHAEGHYTTASGKYSHAEGFKTTASKATAHAEGKETQATANYSHAEGQNTIASGAAQHVQGKFNVSDGYYAHIVGNGSSDTKRSNAHTLDWSGNAWFAGKITVGNLNSDPADAELTTGYYVRNYIDSIKDEIVAIVLEEVNKQLGLPISFSINGITYQAKSGMTWGQWVESDYNTGGFTISSDGEIELDVGGEYVVWESGDWEWIDQSDVIVANHDYGSEV